MVSERMRSTCVFVCVVNVFKVQCTRVLWWIDSELSKKWFYDFQKHYKYAPSKSNHITHEWYKYIDVQRGSFRFSCLRIWLFGKSVNQPFVCVLVFSIEFERKSKNSKIFKIASYCHKNDLLVSTKERDLNWLIDSCKTHGMRFRSNDSAIDERRRKPHRSL